MILTGHSLNYKNHLEFPKDTIVKKGFGGPYLSIPLEDVKGKKEDRDEMII